MRFERQNIGRTIAVLDKIETVILGTCFAIGLLVTWSSQTDSKSYYHLTFCVVAAGIIITSIAVAVASARPAVKATTAGLSGCCRIAAICIMAFYKPGSLLVPIFAISSVDIVPLPLTLAKFIVMVFTAVQLSSPAAEKVSVGLLCFDTLSTIAKNIVKWKLKPKEQSSFD